MAEIAVKLAISKGGELVGKVVEKLHSSISEELSLLRGVRSSIQYIIDELAIMSAFLRDAEERQASDEVAKAWVKQVRELAYAAEDCIDEFSLHLQHRDSSRNFLAAAFQHGARTLGSLGARHRIAAEIQDIKLRVEEVRSRRLHYGITGISRVPSGEDSQVAQHDHRLAALFVKDSQLVGIDEPQKKITGWLLNESERQFTVIAVVGTDGLGKTTIVRKAYESPNVSGAHFMCRAWITVSQVYNLDGILKDMIRQVFPQPKEETDGAQVSHDSRDQLPKDLDSMGREKLISTLKHYLQNKKYVIVFDDIWEINAWNSLKIALPDENDLGSRVLLTTRINSVAETCCSQYGHHIYPLQNLTSEQSMELFCKRVFANSEDTCSEDLKKPLQGILRKCDGLPLAILSIAGVLASKPGKVRQEWQNMLDQLGSELEYNANLEEMKRILNFSYNDLPYHIKRCFLYLSKFPEDYLIERKRIQRLWIAEGFVTGRRDMTIDEVAESYFNELINRFMILPSTFNVLGKVKNFRVHDIMLELIVSKSMEDSFVTLSGKNTTWVSHDVIRRLSIHAEHNLKDMSLSHAKSLSLFGVGRMQIFISPSLGMLRVLDLEGCSGLCNKHIKIVVKLLHLKYLSLRNVRTVSKLPKSLGNLRNLEILDVRGSRIYEMPKGLAKLQSLQMLRGPRIHISGGTRSLRSLQELSCVNLGKSSTYVVKELGRLNQLRKLGVRNIPKNRQQVFCESLKALSSSLRSLSVQSSYGLAFLDELNQRPLLLESLTLDGELGKLPRWICSLTNLVKIHLERSGLEGDDGIKALGTLSNLIKLELSWKAYKGDDLCFGAEGFPCLKALHLSYLSLRSLCFQARALSHLESVSIVDINSWGSRRTSISGIDVNLTSLKEINIVGMHREDLAEVNAQVNRHPKHPRLTATLIFPTWEAEQASTS